VKKNDFYFELPPELIAQFPLKERADARLLVYHRQTNAVEHQTIRSLHDFLNPGDLLVMNNSKVIPARLLGTKASGGKIELLVERILTEDTFLAHVKASKATRVHTVVTLEAGWSIEVLEKVGDLYRCQANGAVLSLLSDIGHIPLPPYIQRADNVDDVGRYQTVYAVHAGSVAAPTAGLHIDAALLEALRAKGVQTGFVTLHVGAGTFRPVRAEVITEHVMHAERIEVSLELVEQVRATKARGNRVIAVGTTVLRSLESAALSGQLKPYEGETSIFIYPGFSFRVCDGLMTNFHVPESTLIMLVAAFIGHQEVMQLYQMAIAARYRFFSYGDACLLL